MRKTYALLNFLIIVGVIFWNYIANAQGINENSVGSLSAAYANLVNPASYAFSIWGIIYLSLTANSIYQLKGAFSFSTADFILNTGPWLIIANIGNAIWMWLWLTEKTGLSVLVMLIILVSLLKIVLSLGIGVSQVSKKVKLWVWFPVSLYTGWITVATVANASAYLAKIGWEGPFSEVTWAIVMLLVATLVYVFVLKNRGMVTFAAVGIWAILAIAIRHWDTVKEIRAFSLLCIAALGIGVFTQLFIRRSRATNHPVDRAQAH